MNKISTKKIVFNGLMIALVFLATRFTQIPGPVPPGYINFGDIVIMVAAVLMGGKSGFLVGSVGSALADISLGAYIFAPITFIVKGLEGYVAGLIAQRGKDRAQAFANDGKADTVFRIAAFTIGALVMVAGYFFAELYILKFFDSTFGYVAAMTELPLNLVQGGISAAAGIALSIALSRTNVQKYILD